MSQAYLEQIEFEKENSKQILQNFQYDLSYVRLLGKQKQFSNLSFFLIHSVLQRRVSKWSVLGLASWVHICVILMVFNLGKSVQKGLAEWSSINLGSPCFMRLFKKN